MSGRIVVVGASLGGLRAAEAVLAAGWTGEVVVVGDEPHLPYNRPPLSKEALAGGVTHEGLAFRLRKTEGKVDWRLGVGAVEVNLAGHDLVLADGSVLAWDGLVVATGLRARRLAIPAPAGGRHAVRTLEDAAALRADLEAARRVVVVGAGFIGCEVAATAVGLGCEVDVVAPEEVPLQRPLGLDVGAAMRRRHEARGVRFHLGRLPSSVEPRTDDDGRVGAVVLDDGTRLEADVVVEALGCLPNVEWLAGTGIDTGDGVLVDGWMRAVADGSPRADVVAVGDVARFPNALFDDVPRRVEHWNIPTETGKRAGAALVAGLTGAPLDPAPFAPMPAFWSDQYGERLQSFGALGLGDDVKVLEGDLDGEFVAAWTRQGRLVGVAGIGLMQRLLALRAEIAQAAAQV